MYNAYAFIYEIWWKKKTENEKMYTWINKEEGQLKCLSIESNIIYRGKFIRNSLLNCIMLCVLILNMNSLTLIKDQLYYDYYLLS